MFALGVAALICAAALLAALVGSIRTSEANRIAATDSRLQREQAFVLLQAMTDTEITSRTEEG